MAFRLAALIILLGCANAKTRFVDQYYTCEMGFFVSTTQVQGTTSVSDADAQCQALSSKVGDCNKRPWRAYLSSPSVNARDRIGSGPWYNVAGQLFASSIQSLYATAPASTLFLTEIGQDASSFNVLTGSTVTGLLGLTCETTAGSATNYGTPQSQWSLTTNSSCGTTYRLYCFASD